MRSWFEDNLALLEAKNPEMARILADCPKVFKPSTNLAQKTRQITAPPWPQNPPDLPDQKAPKDQQNLPAPQNLPDQENLPNSQALEDLWAQGGCLLFPISGTPYQVSLSPGPKDLPCLSFLGQDSQMRLVSVLSPQNEDKALVDRFLNISNLDLDGVTLLGFGLGYHAEYLAQKLPPEAPLWLIEAIAPLAAAAFTARDLSSLLTRPGFTLRLGPTPSLPKGAPKNILARPANLRINEQHFGNLYPIKLKPNHSLHLEQAKQAGHPEHSEHTEHSNQAGRSKHPEHSEHPKNSEHTEHSEQADQAAQGNQGNQANKEEYLQNSEPNYAPHLRPL
ncbi:MAG: hypothetical protein LBE31_02915, partial [Deltaproteobacteria bacterium]|nr:hypothetical protein [Deltaproteobacteria bacterium]